MDKDQVFSLDDLAEYDGSDGGPAYAVFEGKVYDITDSPMWDDGLHESEHQAGADLTEAMDYAPHGPEVLDSFPVIGVFADEG